VASWAANRIDLFARGAQNLRRDSRAALVVEWDEEQTLQLQGRADEPFGLSWRG